MTMTSDTTEVRYRRSTTGRYVVAGFAIILLLIGGIGSWAATTEIAGAVLASGRVVVETNHRKGQHPTGGVVSLINVKSGDHVKAGALLIRLDETITNANLQVIVKQLDQLAIRAARLAAERDALAQFDLPEPYQDRMDDPDIKRIVDGERKLFESRRQSHIKQLQQLRQRVQQNREEIQGIESQAGAKRKEIALMREELAALETLEQQQLVTTSRMVSIRREAARLEGDLGRFVASAARIKGQISEIELQILALEQELQTKIVDELRQIETKQAELEERRIAAQDMLTRIEIRAPISGIVHQLSVHTVGGVINPAEPVMLIVPQDDKLIVEARVAPQDIDRIFVDQPARVVFSAFNQRTTPELDGVVKHVAADLARDDLTGETYFQVRIVLPDDQVQRLGDNTLVPGMPADVLLTTDSRTALSYLIKPLEDQFSKAFRER
jgi:membrane fusion protein, type I secretion system